MKSGKVTIGKGKSNDLVINNSYVSTKNHCIITSSSIIDNSTNGTLVHPRTNVQEKYGIQSNFVPFDSEVAYVFFADKTFKVTWFDF